MFCKLSQGAPAQVSAIEFYRVYTGESPDFGLRHGGILDAPPTVALGKP